MTTETKLKSIFKTWKTSRDLYLEYFEQFTLEQLNHIPKGFSNNLIWNIGHIIVAQQAIIYKGSNLTGYISDELFQLYKPGTIPTGLTTKPEVEKLKELLLSMIDKTKIDYHEGKFITYNERLTGTGFQLNNLMDAFEFNNYHEGLHLGCMMSIKKFV